MYCFTRFKRHKNENEDERLNEINEIEIHRWKIWSSEASDMVPAYYLENEREHTKDCTRVV